MWHRAAVVLGAVAAVRVHEAAQDRFRIHARLLRNRGLLLHAQHRDSCEVVGEEDKKGRYEEPKRDHYSMDQPRVRAAGGIWCGCIVPRPCIPQAGQKEK